jgi:hypothetical protein
MDHDAAVRFAVVVLDAAVAIGRRPVVGWSVVERPSAVDVVLFM